VQRAAEPRMTVRTALHRATVAIMCGSLEGEQRRSAWLHEQARLLSADESLRRSLFGSGVPAPRRPA
jgi:hypothetical protein